MSKFETWFWNKGVLHLAYIIFAILFTIVIKVNNNENSIWILVLICFIVLYIFGCSTNTPKRCSRCCITGDLYSIEHNGKAEYLVFGLLGNSREKSKILCKSCMQEMKDMGSTIDILKYDIRKLS